MPAIVNLSSRSREVPDPLFVMATPTFANCPPNLRGHNSAMEEISAFASAGQTMSTGWCSFTLLIVILNLQPFILIVAGRNPELHSEKVGRRSISIAVLGTTVPSQVTFLQVTWIPVSVVVKTCGFPPSPVSPVGAASEWNSAAEATPPHIPTAIAAMTSWQTRFPSECFTSNSTSLPINAIHKEYLLKCFRRHWRGPLPT